MDKTQCDTSVKDLLEKASQTGDLSREEIVALLSVTNKKDFARILATADEVSKAYCGDDVHVRALIEFSNICIRNCKYCGLRRDNHKVRRYRMPISEIIDTSIECATMGFGTVVLQSGEDPWFTAERMAHVIREIKRYTNCAVTLCIGEMTYEEYRTMRQAGADRYLLRHETATPELYAQLHPDMVFENRLRCLRDLRALGYQIGAGSMVGLPGQTVADMADDVVFIKTLDPDMVGIGPFIPHPNTPLGDNPAGTLDMTLKMVALTRILTRNALIPATTAVGSISPYGREKALMAGANVVMVNCTPPRHRVNYEIYPGKQNLQAESSDIFAEIGAWIESIGRKVGSGPGHSLKLNPQCH